MRKTTLFAISILMIAFAGINSALAQWQYSGVDIYNSNAGFVAIGNTTPGTLLYVAKNMGEPAITIRNMGGGGGATYSMVDDLSGADWKFKATMYGGFKIRDHAYSMDVLVMEPNSAANTIYVKGGGNVGIGMNTPQFKLDVSADARINGVRIGRGSGDVYSNTAIGYQTMEDNTVGYYNVAGGMMALTNNTEGSSNSAFGCMALAGNTEGILNTAVGQSALLGNETGSYNTAVGNDALINFGNGYSNTAIGASAHQSNGSGSANVAVGRCALYSSQTGSFLVAVGDSALYNNGSGAIGNQATANTAVGSKALFTNKTGQECTALGHHALMFNSSGNQNTAVGADALLMNNSGYYNTAVGYSSLSHNLGGQYNVALGMKALELNEGGYSNTAVGYQSGRGNTSGYWNTAVGNNAMFANSDGFCNTAVGTNTLISASSTEGNTAVGGFASELNQGGDYNTAVGGYSLRNNLNGNFNTAVGGWAALNNQTGSFNTAIGDSAMYYNQTGSYNTCVGARADIFAYSVSNAILIGYHCFSDINNRAVIGNNYMSSIGGYQSWSVYSDGRFKENVTEDVPGLAFINLLRPVSFTKNPRKLDALMGLSEQNAWEGKDNAEKIRYTGFIAQEVQQAATQLHYEFSGVDDTGGIMSLRYAEFVAPLVKAIQEQQAEIEALKAEVKLLKEGKE